MGRLHGFPPNAAENARILVLGSMPGAASLAKQEYYAHKYNSFWRIMGTLFDFDPALSYGERLRLLRKNGIALWDVAGSCEREGSLDSNIRTVVPNDIASLLKKYPSVRKILCNGGTAFRLLSRYGKECFPLVDEVVKMPSTSPAAARLSFGEKLAAYRNELVPDPPHPRGKAFPAPPPPGEAEMSVCALFAAGAEQ